MSRRVSRFAGWVVWLTVAAASTAAGADCPSFSNAVQVGTVQSGSLTESSGIAASRKNADVLWVHNDSGDTARVFAMSAAGSHLGIYSLSGTGATDWEDMAIGPGPASGVDYLYLGDIGDNNAVRGNIVVFRVAEPTVDSHQSPVTLTLTGVDAIRLSYPDGARDAETLMVDPVTRDIYIVSKRETYSRVYVAKYPQSTTNITTLEYKGQLPWGWATGGDISWDGSLVAVRGYFNAMVWRRVAGTEVFEALQVAGCAVPLASEPQGEAIGFDRLGCGYYTVSEGTNPAIYYFGRNGQCPLPGDLNGDGEVDLSDLQIFVEHWLGAGCSVANLWCGKADANQSQSVDLRDFEFLQQDWGQ